PTVPVFAARGGRSWRAHHPPPAAGAPRAGRPGRSTGGGADPESQGPAAGLRMPETHGATLGASGRTRRSQHHVAGDNDGSVTAWIASLKAGDADAAQALWRRYFAALVRRARDKLRGAPKAVADEEDAALNAFDSFVRGAAGGRYPL